MKTKPKVVLGIDVSKTKLDVCLLRPESSPLAQSFSNDPVGFTRLAAWLHQQSVAHTHVGLEATGPYSRRIAQFLHEQSHTVSVLNPARPKSFAQARGCRNKTDGIDCQTLAEFVLAQSPEAWEPLSEEMAALQELVRRREDLLVMHGAEQARQEGASAQIAKSINRIVKAIQSEIQRIEQALEELIQSSPELRRQRRLLCTIKGVREITAAKILAELGDPKRFAQARQAGAFAGLTPKLHQSGKRQSSVGRICRIGSPLLRKALYLPSIVAMTHNPRFKVFAHRLRKAGKPPKVIITAVMRKLIVTATAMLRNDQPFQLEHSPC